MGWRLRVEALRGIILRRVQPRLGQRLRDRDVDDVRRVDVKNFARVARDGRFEKSVDEIAIGEERMAMLAVVFGGDGPETVSDGLKEGTMEAIK
jgi:hypothetical protein